MSHPPDYHIHTRFSCDCDTDLAAICEATIARGLNEIALTDHVDFGPADPLGYFRPLEFLSALERCRARYAGRLTIRAGVEMGEPHIFTQEAAAVLAVGDFDFVIGSAHYAEGMRHTWAPSYFEQPLNQAFEAYFRQVVRLADQGDFDVLGHLDIVKRDARDIDLPYNGPEHYEDLIRSALRSVIERGKGIELNTSPLRRGQPDTCPSMQVLRWYRELGGEILTLGSDAHKPDDVGASFGVAADMARAAGFTRLAAFEKRQIRWVAI